MTLSWERVDRAWPGTGVGRPAVGIGTAPHPSRLRRATFPQGKAIMEEYQIWYIL